MLYQRYIISMVLKLTIMLIILITSITWIAQTLRILYLFEKGIAIYDFVKVASLLLPFLLFITMPFSLLIAIFIIYNNMIQDRQLMVLKTSGLNNFNLMKPILYITFFSTIILYYIGSYLLPISYTQLKNNIASISESFLLKRIEVNKFNNISKHITIYVKEKLPDQTLKNIILFDNSDSKRKITLFAREGKIIHEQNKSFIVMYDGKEQFFDENQQSSFLSFNKMVTKIFDKDQSNINRKISDLELFIPEMIWPKEENITIKRKNKLLTDANQRLTWPILHFAFLLIAIYALLKKVYYRKFPIANFLINATVIVGILVLYFIIQKIAIDYIWFIFVNHLMILSVIVVYFYLINRKTIAN